MESTFVYEIQHFDWVVRLINQRRVEMSHTLMIQADFSSEGERDAVFNALAKSVAGILADDPRFVGLVIGELKTLLQVGSEEEVSSKTEDLKFRIGLWLERVYRGEWGLPRRPATILRLAYYEKGLLPDDVLKMTAAQIRTETAGVHRGHPGIGKRWATAIVQKSKKVVEQMPT